MYITFQKSVMILIGSSESGITIDNELATYLFTRKSQILCNFSQV
jgi:hypothetical protein